MGKIELRIKETEKLYKEPNISPFARTQRMNSLGHVERMSNASMSKWVLQKRSKGQTRKRTPRERRLWI